MKYQIICTKTATTTAYRATQAEAEALASRMERMGYLVNIWERDEHGARPLR